MGSMTGPLYVDGIQTLGMMMAPAGRIFYFNPNASGTARNADRPWYNTWDELNDTQNPTIFNTLQGAIDACVADRGDIIFVARGYYGATATTNFNKQGITVIAQQWGQNFRAQGENFGIDPSAVTDGPAARITKGCTLIGLGFYGAQASGDDYTAAMQIDGTDDSSDGYGTHLIGCRFGNWNRAAVNYGIVNQGATALKIEQCYFAGGAANRFEAGILFDESTTGGAGRPGSFDVKDCYFEDSLYALEVVVGSRVTKSVWERNKMGYSHPDSAWVKFLKQGSIGGVGTLTGNLICDNFFATAVDTGTFSHTLTQLETEGYRFSGNHYASDLGQLT